jgi:hypothetical protein
MGSQTIPADLPGKQVLMRIADRMKEGLISCSNVAAQIRKGDSDYVGLEQELKLLFVFAPLSWRQLLSAK